MSSKTIKRELVCNNVINLGGADTVNLKSTEAWGHTYYIVSKNQDIILPRAEAGMNITFFSNVAFGTDPTGPGPGGSNNIANSSSVSISTQGNDTIRANNYDTTSTYLPINANTGYDTRVHKVMCFVSGVWTVIQRTTIIKVAP